MKFKRIIPYLFLLVAIVLIFVSYKDIVRTFYQQDEWLTLGYVKAGAGLDMLHGATFFELLGGKYRALSLPLQIFIYRYFGFNTYGIGILALVLHLIASFVLYRMLYRLTKNHVVSFITGLVFVVCSTSIQSITWYATTFQTIPSFIFLWLSLYETMLYINGKKTQHFWLSFMYSVAAFLFKESGGIALILNPLFYILYSKPKPNSIAFIKRYGIFIAYVGYIGYVRYMGALVAPQYQSSSFLGASSSGYQKILINFLLYPYLSFSQIFLPQKFVYDMARWFQSLYYQCCVTNSNAVAMGQIVTSDLLTSFLSMPLVLMVAVSYVKSKKKEIFQFLILFYILSYFPFINIERGSSYLDSRYIYISSAIGICLVLYSLFELLSSIRHKFTRRSLLSIAGVGIFLLMIIHIRIDRNDMRLLMYQSQERLSVLGQIKALIPKLPNKPIFYIEQPLPFQQGVGHTLMVWYADDVQVPRPFLASDFLWGIRDQGYQEFQTYGFGYYRDLKDLQNAVTVNHIQKEQIIGLSYDADNKKMTNSTNIVIGEIY